MADKQNKGAAAGAAKDAPAGKKGEEAKKEEKKGLADEELVSSLPINVAMTYTLSFVDYRVKKTSN